MLTKPTQSLRFRRSSRREGRAYHKQNCYPKLRDMVRAHFRLVLAMMFFLRDSGSSNNLFDDKKGLFSLTAHKTFNVKECGEKTKKVRAIKDMHESYIALCDGFIVKIEAIIPRLDKAFLYRDQLTLIAHWIMHAKRQMAQIKQRVIDEIKIPHNEKVFSIFEPHTEWISKGKAGVPVELGIKVCIVEDQAGFILKHQVM
jgi:IS5 family transposase